VAQALIALAWGTGLALLIAYAQARLNGGGGLWPWSWQLWAHLTLAVLMATICMRVWLGRRLGGYVGDGLGAVEQLAELAVWLVLSLHAVS
jgi:cobalamin synthase